MKHKKLATTLAVCTILLSIAGQATVPAFAASPTFLQGLTQKYGKVEVDQAQVTAINGTTLTVSKNGTTYTVTTTSSTIFYRRYFGVGNLNQINIGDYVNVRGSCSDNNTISADFVRDTSIQEYKDTFGGTVSQTNSNGFVLASNDRGNQTVNVDGNTKLTDKNGNAIALSQMQVNDHVALDGIWDHTQNIIYDVDYIHDYSLPN